MQFDWNTVLQVVEDDVLPTIQKLAPFASLAGPEGALIGGIVGKGAELGGVLLARATDVQTVISDTDLARVQAATDKLRAVNADLFKQVEEG